jgi:two-component system OmpR family sensor kinase
VRRLPGRFTLRRLSLRRRLTLVLIGFLFLSCATLGLVSLLALHGYLVGRLDQQLRAAGDRYAVSLEHPSDNDADNEFSSVIGQQTGTLGARMVAGVVTAAGIVTDAQATGSVSAADRAVIGRLRVGGPRDVQLPGLGEYRVVVVNGDDGDQQVTGLPKKGVDATIGRLALIELVVIGAAVLLTGLAGTVCIRLTLRPLDRVSRTARSVTDLPLGKGEVQLPERLVTVASGTEIGQLTDAVNRMLEHLESAFAERHHGENLLRQFVADASHELRTPIAVISSHAEYALMAGESLPAEVTELLGRIMAESARMGLLVQDLLLLARLDSGRALLSDTVDLTRLVLDAVIDARALARGHEFNLDLPEHDVCVRGDPHSLRQVVLNLLTNATGHTPAGTTVTVRLSADDSSAILVVSDNGPGIGPEFLPHVFERFARADDARGRDGGEGGLGLSIVDAIVRAHSGTISVNSRPGETAFSMRIPLSVGSG